MPGAGWDVVGRVVISPRVVSTCGAAPLCMSPLRKRRAADLPRGRTTPKLTIVVEARTRLNRTARGIQSCPSPSDPREGWDAPQISWRWRSPPLVAVSRHASAELPPPMRADVVHAKAGLIMAPVYPVVKAGSTRYCALFLGQAQDIDRSPIRLAFSPNALIRPTIASALPTFELLRDDLGALGERSREHQIFLLQRLIGRGDVALG